MRTDHRLVVILLGILAAGLVILPSSVGADPIGERLAGTWLAIIDLPALPPLGITEPVQMPEYVTYHADGTGFANVSTPAFPVPRGGGQPTPAMLTTLGLGSWEKIDTKTIRVVNWRFLNDPATGELVAYMKVRLELEFVTPDQLEGTYFAEILDPDLAPMLLGGQPMAFGGHIVENRVPAEPLAQR